MSTAPVFISLGAKKSGSGGAVFIVLLLLVALVVTPFIVLKAAPCWLHDTAPTAFEQLNKAAKKIKLTKEEYTIDDEECDAPK